MFSNNKYVLKKSLCERISISTKYYTKHFRPNHLTEQNFRPTEGLLMARQYFFANILKDVYKNNYFVERENQDTLNNWGYQI